MNTANLRFFITFLFPVIIVPCPAQPQKSLLPLWKTTENNFQTDWLVTPVNIKAQVFKSADGRDIILYNGLLKRTFRLQPNVACTDYENTSTGQQLLRALKAEARLTINGREFNVGGLHGQKENAYLLPEWVDGLSDNENDFQFQFYSVKDIQPYINWKTSRWAANRQQATGKMLSFIYKPGRGNLQNIMVSVNYELYDGIPLIVKWLSVENNSGQTIRLNRVVNEVLALVEEESAVVGTSEQMKNNMECMLKQTMRSITPCATISAIKPRTGNRIALIPRR